MDGSALLQVPGTTPAAPPSLTTTQPDPKLLKRLEQAVNRRMQEATWLDSANSLDKLRWLTTAGKLFLEASVSSIITACLRSTKSPHGTLQNHAIIFNTLLDTPSLSGIALRIRHRCSPPCLFRDDPSNQELADALLLYIGAVVTHVPFGRRALRPWLDNLFGILAEGAILALSPRAPSTRAPKRPVAPAGAESSKVPKRAKVDHASDARVFQDVTNRRSASPVPSLNVKIIVGGSVDRQGKKGKRSAPSGETQDPQAAGPSRHPAVRRTVSVVDKGETTFRAATPKPGESMNTPIMISP
ncbi:hypothetical protein FB451DRAFT_1252595 [Mycena latifolia]|nr:hypothetical protein FB451DRAFT_1252595 [Mycena latifolia]